MPEKNEARLDARMNEVEGGVERRATERCRAMADSCGGEVGWADISRSARTDSLHTTGAPHVMDRGAARCLFSTLALTNQSLAITLAHTIHFDLPGPRVFCKKK